MGVGRGRGWGREGGDWLTAPLAAVKFAHSNFNVTGQWCSDPVLVKSSIREIDTWRRTTRFHPTNFRERIGGRGGEKTSIPGSIVRPSSKMSARILRRRFRLTITLWRKLFILRLIFYYVARQMRRKWWNKMKQDFKDINLLRKYLLEFYLLSFWNS